jgi:hypothetical protein
MTAKNCFILAFALTGFVASSQAQVITEWTFETSAPTTSGPVSAELGTGTASGSHAGATVYSSPAGDGSAHSYSSTLWAIGDYYQLSLSTAGFSQVSLSYDQISSSTGPGNFLLTYSIDGGTTFNPIGSTYSVIANSTPNAWSATVFSGASVFAPTLPADVANETSLIFRLVDESTTSANGGTVASGGTDRIDNFDVSVPEPSSLALIGLGAASLLGLCRRK